MESVNISEQMGDSLSSPFGNWWLPWMGCGEEWHLFKDVFTSRLPVFQLETGCIASTKWNQ